MPIRAVFLKYFSYINWVIEDLKYWQVWDCDCHISASISEWQISIKTPFCDCGGTGPQ